jgi:hypothetical protein
MIVMDDHTSLIELGKYSAQRFCAFKPIEQGTCVVGPKSDQTTPNMARDNRYCHYKV